jgi:hypothetical protein
MGFVVDRMSLGQVLLRVLFSHAKIIPPTLHTHSFKIQRGAIMSTVGSVVKLNNIITIECP